ncbi:hypothetical protein AB6A40_003665 [Gnathostoma spinigerum]|uniref:Uncharacterized protein n=1 Tax=Gnathostoma spinigerum TaxID=75299 RepID=A0ABD6EBD5_9BILA
MRKSAHPSVLQPDCMGTPRPQRWHCLDLRYGEMQWTGSDGEYIC